MEHMDENDCITMMQMTFMGGTDVYFIFKS
jgi:hypothetical protein